MTDRLRKRPRDPAQLAKLMIDIASGEIEDRNAEILIRGFGLFDRGIDPR